jgi:hypothetical protein
VLDQPDNARQIGEGNAGGVSGGQHSSVAEQKRVGRPFDLPNSSTNEREECGQQRRWTVACVWRRKSFLTAMLQDSLQRSTAGRPQLRGLTETGEQRTPRQVVCSRWPLLLQAACPMLLHCQCAMGVAGKLFRRETL